MSSKKRAIRLSRITTKREKDVQIDSALMGSGDFMSIFGPALNAYVSEVMGEPTSTEVQVRDHLPTIYAHTWGPYA